MKQQKTVESRVLEILKECPMSRYDDMLLILHYYNRYGYIPAGNLPLEDIVLSFSVTVSCILPSGDFSTRLSVSLQAERRLVIPRI